MKKNKSIEKKMITISQKEKGKIIIELSDNIELNDIINFSMSLFTLLIDKSDINENSILDMLQVILEVLINSVERGKEREPVLKSNSIYSNSNLTEEEIKMAEIFSKVWKNSFLNFS